MSEVIEKIETFQNGELGVIRVTTINGEPWFVAKDVCEILGYSNGRDALSKHVDTPDVAKCDMGVVTGKKADGTDAIQVVKTSVVNESGLYALVFGSKLEKAKAFKRWVTSEVLPSIRKHGAYATDITIDRMIADPDFAISLLTNLKEEREARRLAEEKKAMLEEKVETDAPKVTFAETIMGSESAISIDELAKLITQEMEKRGIKFSIGQNNLFKWLRVNGYLGTTGAYYNIPNQRYVEAGYFEVRKGMRLGKGGEVIETSTPKVKTKGQQYFINKFINANYI